MDGCKEWNKQFIVFIMQSLSMNDWYECFISDSFVIGDKNTIHYRCVDVNIADGWFSLYKENHHGHNSQ